MGTERPASAGGGKLIVITAPLTEIIDHAGYFIQMSMASLPMWLEGILNKKYPKWRDLEYNDDGARYMPAGVRVLEASLLRRFAADDMVCCYPDDVDKFIGPRTRIVAISTHNPLGVTFAAGVYTSIFGSSKQPINAHYSRKMFATVKNKPESLLVPGHGRRLGRMADRSNQLLRGARRVDCVVEGRSEAEETLALFDKAINGERLPRKVDVHHPQTRDGIIFPDKRTTFGVVEMTTGCGRRCQFCVPDLNPQIDLPRDKILAHVRANVRDGNKQISLATEDMFIWGRCTRRRSTFRTAKRWWISITSVVNTPGVEQHVLSHATIAPAVVDPILIEQLTDSIIEKSPIHIPVLSKHPKKALVPLIGLETGSIVRAKAIMPSKAVPFPIEEWQSVVIRGLEVLNKHNWFPAMTLIIGSPNETDDDVKATLDVIYEVERRGLFAFFIPSIFTPLHDTRMEKRRA